MKKFQFDQFTIWVSSAPLCLVSFSSARRFISSHLAWLLAADPLLSNLELVSWRRERRQSLVTIYCCNNIEIMCEKTSLSTLLVLSVLNNYMWRRWPIRFFCILHIYFLHKSNKITTFFFHQTGLFIYFKLVFEPKFLSTWDKQSIRYHGAKRFNFL